MIIDINDLTHRIIGCAMKVHSTLGGGFREFIYQRALALEMEQAGLFFSQEQEMEIFYLGTLIGTRRVDFFIEKRIMLEIKAADELLPRHKLQAINYLEIYGVADGLLINFGGPSLEFKRLYNKHKVNMRT
jgi:GxxExxY protein